MKADSVVDLVKMAAKLRSGRGSAAVTLSQGSPKSLLEPSEEFQTPK